jgi:hypothetical protein
MCDLSRESDETLAKERSRVASEGWGGLSGDTPVFGERGRSLPDHHQAFGLSKRKRPHQGRISQRKDGAVDADAERQGERRHEREPARRSTAAPPAAYRCAVH